MTDYIKWFKKFKELHGDDILGADTEQPLKFKLTLSKSDLGRFAIPGVTIEIIDYDDNPTTVSATFSTTDSSSAIYLLDELFYYRLRYRSYEDAKATANVLIAYLGDEDPEMREFANEVLQDIIPIMRVIDDDQK